MSENHGTICWNELATHDVKAARDYYAAVCGWSFDEAPMDGTVYTVARLGDRMIAGIFDMNSVPGLEQMRPGWMTYLEVDDVDEAVRQTRAGGEALRGPWDMPGVGRIAVVKDPSGAVVGYMKPTDTSAPDG